MLSFWGRPRPSRASRARLGLERLEDRLALSTLIPVPSRSNFVFDPMRGQLDIATSAGQLMIFSEQSQQVVATLTLSSTPLGGMDITPDETYLYVADQATNGTTGVVHRVNLNTFQVTNATYARASGESGAWDLAFGPGNIGLLDTVSSAGGPLHQINESSNTLSTRGDFPATGAKVASTTTISRSADRSLMLLAEPNGSLFTYNALTNTFLAGPNIGGSLANAPTAVSHNGALMAVEVNNQVLVMDSHFNLRNVLSGYTGGIAFDPNQDVLYAVNAQTDQVAAINTDTWAVEYQLPIGEPVPPVAQTFGEGVLAVSSDSRYLYLATPSGVREIAQPDLNPATTLVVSYPSATTAGTPFPVTVTALDAYGQVDTGYQGTVHFTSTDPKAVLPADYTFTLADAGVHTFTPDLKTEGGQQLVVKDTTNTNLASYTTVYVNPGAASTLLVTAPSPDPVGYATTLTVSALDAYGNPIPFYTGTVHLSSTDPQAVLPADYTFTANDHGTHAFNVTPWTAGYQTFTATDDANSSVKGSATALVANCIPGLHFSVTTSAASVTAGSAFSVTVTALDQYNHVATPYVGTLTFSSSDHGAGVVLPANYTFTAAADGVHTFLVTLVTAAAHASVTFHDTNYITGAGAGAATVAVTPAAAASFTVAGFPSADTAGSPGTVVVTAYDPYGNVATGYTGTVQFTSSDPQAGLPADYTFTAADAGAHTFSADLLTAGVQSLTVTDTTLPSLTGSETGIAVNPAPAAFLVLSAQGTPQAGVPLTVTLSVLDAYGNVVTGYAGVVSFQSTDPAASLPAGYTFTGSDQGQHAFQVTFGTPGAQTLSVSDGTLVGSLQVSL
jgi:hypothetical protein